MPCTLFAVTWSVLCMSTMPLGLSWGKYIGAIAASLGSMLAGASVVHHIYKPDLTVPVEPVPKPSGEVGKLTHALISIQQ